MTFNHKALNALLVEEGMKPSQLADLTRIPRNTISYYLKGATSPKNDRAKLIADVLAVSVESLYTEDAAVMTGPAPKLLLSVVEAAEMMGCSPQRIRQGIVNDDWNPSIGSAIREKGEKAKYQFHIPLRRVQSYLLILPEQSGVLHE